MIHISLKSDLINAKLIASRFVFLYFGPLQISSKLGTVRQLIKQRESNYIFHKSFQCSLELQLLKTNGLRSLHLVTRYAFNVLLTLILWQIVHYMKANTSHASNDQSCLDIKVGSCSSYWAKSKCFPYLIFVHSINSGASVKKLTEGNFFTINAKKTPDSVLLYTVCTFTHSV